MRCSPLLVMIVHIVKYGYHLSVSYLDSITFWQPCYYLEISLEAVAESQQYL